MEAFQAWTVHAGDLTTLQRAKLFTGGLPDYIRMDVEMHQPQNLQHAMYLARAFECHNAPQRLALPAPQRATRRLGGAPPTVPASTTGTTPDSTKAFKRLTPKEMAERRKLGLCYNCDEPFARGHKCARLFYLEVLDYIVEEPEEPDDVPPPAEEAPFDPDKPMISLSAATGIRARDTM
jgi:hypothetical protein